MPHKKIIVDKDPFFTIDTQTRVITNQSTKKVTLMKNDHHSERFTFELPRYIEGHDMSTCYTELHFINADSSTKEETFGVYVIDDLEISAENEGKLTFSWLLSQAATSRAGALLFSIRFSCQDEEGNVVYVWNTAIHTGIAIANTICNDGDDTIVDYPISGGVSAEIEELKKKLEEYVTEADVDAKIQNVKIPVDEALDATSENPVQNKVITEKMEELAAEVESKGESRYPKFVAECWNGILFWETVRFKAANLPMTLPPGTRLEFEVYSGNGDGTTVEEYSGVLTTEIAGAIPVEGGFLETGKVHYEITNGEVYLDPPYNGSVAGDTVTITLPDYWEYCPGQKTEYGEIFNDYDSNRALYTNNHAEGSGTTAGFTGYKMLNLTANGTSSIDIEVRDSGLSKKASSAYAVGDAINFEAQMHWAEIATVNSFSTSDDGNTVINVTYFTQHDLDASEEEAENWLSVTGKEGGEIIAQYHSAHAEGEDTVAAGRSGHAEGRNTKVIGNHGHAEGRNTKAGYCAHAEGKDAEALADSSHAEGNSKATGMRAHAENSNTEARGAYSHSEGLHTIATGVSQHVQGQYNIADSSMAHIVGWGTGTAESQRKNIHTLDKNGNGWFAGDVTVGTNKDKLATEAGLDAGLSAKADKATTLAGYGITDSAGLKTASGEIFNDYTNNKAITAYTHAEGGNTLAGSRSFKILSVVSTNQLQLDSVTGLESEDVISYSVYVSGEGVLKSGWTPYYDAAAIGTIDSANKIITLDRKVDSRLTNDAIENHTSVGYAALWVNEKPEAGTVSHSLYGHAEGIRTKALGTAAHSEGTDTVASGVFAHAEGDGCVASGMCAHAEGNNCIAKGMRSHAEGGWTEANGAYSHSEGWHTVAKGTAQHVEGVANEAMNGDYLHIVGNGEVIVEEGVKTVNRSNAYTLDKNGNGWYAGTVEATGIILRSANKKFLLTIDDEGTLKATEVNYADN